MWDVVHILWTGTSIRRVRGEIAQPVLNIILTIKSDPLPLNDL